MNTENKVQLNNILDMNNENLHEAEKLLKHWKIYKNTFDHVTTQLKQALADIPYKSYEVIRRTMYDIWQVLEASVEDKKRNS